MTPKAKRELIEFGAVLGVVYNLLAPHRGLIERFEKEARDMENFGPVLHPTLYRDSERQATAEIVAPIYRAAAEFVDVFERQTARVKSALGKVNG